MRLPAVLASAAVKGPAGSAWLGQHTGQYHKLRACMCVLLQKRVSAAVAEARAERGPSDPLLQMRVRYFNLPGSSGSQQAAADRPKPGVISQELAEALGGCFGDTSGRSAVVECMRGFVHAALFAASQYSE
jgi:hypothetical protein